MVVLIGQKGPCVGFLSCSFFFFVFIPCFPVPFLLIITDGPPLTMPCYACKMQESDGRGVRVCVGG